MVISTFETLLNRILWLDPTAACRLKPLHHKIITLELSGVPFLLQMIITPEKITLHTKDFLIPDTIIQGPPLSLLHMIISPAVRRERLFDQVSIQGNLEVAEQLMTFFDKCQIDWED